MIAHELCHYILELVFENNAHPYYRNDKKAKQEFKKIVDKIRMEITEHLSPLSEHRFKDDGCYKIISSVYQSYDPIDYPPELIVRVLHILSQFDQEDDKDMLDDIIDKYKILFNFFEKYVLPELKLFNLKNRFIIRKYNSKSGILQKLKNEEYALKNYDNFDNNLNGKFPLIISSNVPQLLLHNIYGALKNDKIIDVKNIFIKSEILKDVKVFNDINKTIKSIPDIKFFIDYSKGDNEENLKRFIEENLDKNIVLVSCNQNNIKIMKLLENVKLPLEPLTINYKFSDLNNATQLKILQRELKFQETEKTTLFDLISSDEEIKILKHYNKKLSSNISQKNLTLDFPTISNELITIVDENLLNLFINGECISINSCESEQFDHKIQDRKFLAQNIEFTMNQILNKNCDENVIFITGDYGSGKSWALKHFTNVLRSIYPNNWITYINFDHFLDDLKTTGLDIRLFIEAKLLKLKIQYEINIFNYLYKTGRVVILLDIVNSNSANIKNCINKIINSFNNINNNKLIIASRHIENFENNLFSNGTEYIIKDFSNENGIELFNDIFSNNENKEECIAKALELREELIKISDELLNKPIYYRIIAQSLNDNRRNLQNYSIFKVFKHHINQEYSKKQNASENSSKKEMLLFVEKHARVAINSLFSKALKLTSTVNNVNFNNIESYGFVLKNDFSLEFVNNVYRDYFATEYILNIFLNDKLDDNFLKVFDLVLYSDKHFGIRVLFNSALSDDQLCHKIKINVRNFSCNLKKDFKILNYLKMVFKENLVNFVKLFEIIFEDTKSDLIEKNLKDAGSIENIQNFKIIKTLLKLVNKETIEDYIINEEIFLKLYILDIPISEIIQFKDDLDHMGLSKPMRYAITLQLQSTGDNIVHIACKNPAKIKETFDLINFLSKNEIIEILEQKNKNGDTFLHTFANINQNISNSEYYNILWTNLLRLYENKSKLKKLIFEKNKYNQSFFHIYIANDNAQGIKETCKILKNNIEIYEAILSASYHKNRNLLQIAANDSIDLSVHGELWSIYKEHYKTNERLIEVLYAYDDECKNILHLAACSSESEIFDFLFSNVLNTFENNEKSKVLYNFFKSYDGKEKNLLQLAAKENRNLSFHKNLWEKILTESNFKRDDICRLINFVDTEGYPAMFYAGNNERHIKNTINKKVEEINNSDKTRSDAAKTRYVGTSQHQINADYKGKFSIFNF